MVMAGPLVVASLMPHWVLATLLEALVVMLEGYAALAFPRRCKQRSIWHDEKLSVSFKVMMKFIWIFWGRLSIPDPNVPALAKVESVDTNPD